MMFLQVSPNTSMDANTGFRQTGFQLLKTGSFSILKGSFSTFSLNQVVNIMLVMCHYSFIYVYFNTLQCSSFLRLCLTHSTSSMSVILQTLLYKMPLQCLSNSVIFPPCMFYRFCLTLIISSLISVLSRAIIMMLQIDQSYDLHVKLPSFNHTCFPTGFYTCRSFAVIQPAVLYIL